MQPGINFKQSLNPWMCYFISLPPCLYNIRSKKLKAVLFHIWDLEAYHGISQASSDNTVGSLEDSPSSIPGRGKMSRRAHGPKNLRVHCVPGVFALG
jgi:hypothetical protein